MHKKKAKVLVIGDASSGKSSLIQSYVKKNYQFSSDYTMVLILLFIDSRRRNIFENYTISIIECGYLIVSVRLKWSLILLVDCSRNEQKSRFSDGNI